MKSISLESLSILEGGGAPVKGDQYCRTSVALAELGYFTHNYILLAVGCGLAARYCKYAPCFCGNDADR